MIALPSSRSAGAFRRSDPTRRIALPLALAAVPLLPWTGLQAQQADTVDAQGEVPTAILDPIEVWVVQEKDQARRPETFTLFSQEEMRRSDEVSPYEFFKHVPGVNLTQGHAMGFGLRNPVAGRIQIRGIGRKAGPVDFSARGVLLLMDGVPDFSVTHGHPLPDMFSRSYVDEVEVVKGPSTVRHGWAQAGAVLMRSQDPQTMGVSGHAEASFGAWNTTQNQLHYNYRWQDGFVQVSGSYRQTDGHRDARPDATEAADGRVRFAQKVGEGVNVIGSVRGGTNNWEIPGPVGGSPGVGGNNDWIIADAGVRAKPGAWDVTAKIWAFDAQVEFEDGLKEPNVAQGGRIKAETSPWAGGTVLLGTDLMSYGVGRGFGEDVPMIESPEEAAPYVWVEHAADRWTVNGGLRFTTNSQFGEDVSPEAGVVFRPVPETAIRARAAHGFRAPNPFEFAFFDTRNPDLEATDLWQYELGWNQRLGPFFRFDVVGWIQAGDNMIQSVFDPNVGDVRNRNTGEFDHRGAEAQLQFMHPSGFHAGLGGATMDLDDDTALVPLNTLDFEVGYRGEAFSLGLDGRWATELHQRDDFGQRLPNYVVANLSASYRLRSGVALKARVENLFDEDYWLFQQPVGGQLPTGDDLTGAWTMPGISLFGGVSYTL